MSGKLFFIKSPVAGNSKDSHSDASSVANLGQEQQQQADVQDLGYRDGPHHDCPEFQKHSEATNSEVFYDLLFAANLTVFSDAHDVTDMAALSSYIAYYCILWFTWAIVGLYDVRFVTDSIFERITRAVHVGVMVGIAVVAPNFDPAAQTQPTFRALSVVLMASRLALACQYGTIIYHVRKYRNTRAPLVAMVGLNLVAALIYLGITFAFQDTNTNTYVTWYIVAILEVIVTVGLSVYWKVLSFKGTHLINRMSLLTFIIIGEGVIVVCTGVGKIVVNPDSWTSATIGNVVAGITNVYVVYMIYFDFMRHMHLPTFRQLTWAMVHFPFHLAMTLFIQGSSQFVVWWKIIEVLLGVQDKIDTSLKAADDPNFNVTSEWLSTTLNKTVWDIYGLYPPKYYDTYQATMDSIDSLGNISDSFWQRDNVTDDDPTWISVIDTLGTLYETVENSLFSSFKINGFDNIKNTTNMDSAQFEDAVNQNNWGKFFLVFTYAYICAGLTLIFMNILFIVSRTRRWSIMNYVRVALNFLIGIGLCLVSLIQLNDDRAAAFQSTPMVLPTIMIVFFVVLIINHLPKDLPVFFNKKGTELGGEKDAHAGGRTGSWGVIGHLGYRSRSAHEKTEPGVTAHPAESGYDPYEHTQEPNGAHAV